MVAEYSTGGICLWIVQIRKTGSRREEGVFWRPEACANSGRDKD